MDFIKICGKIRKKIEIGNKKCNNFFRKNKKIPCIIYGKNLNIPFYATVDELNKIMIHNKKCGVFIKLEDNKYIKAIQKEIQYDSVKDTIIHVDFYKIEDSSPIILNIPIEFIGRPIGVIKGGECNYFIKKLIIKSIAKNMPECIRINIHNLDVGDKIVVKNLKINKYIILNSDDELIVKIKIPRVIRTSKEENKKEENKKEENKINN
ncbi:50S ribosomal protein L25 [Blattabacterium cuenoti]|uniref:50S ribosomal protein L25 n=1 Tax=Blattabacterium cuenoti TaxID=1653831 RepID=UPI00163C3CDE|nr:50S ribosomal protein L25 [Blattabacterium cuenoti]